MLSLFYKILEIKTPPGVFITIFKPNKEKQILLIKGKLGQFKLNWSCTKGSILNKMIELSEKSENSLDSNDTVIENINQNENYNNKEANLASPIINQSIKKNINDASVEERKDKIKIYKNGSIIWTQEFRDLKTFNNNQNLKTTISQPFENRVSETNFNYFTLKKENKHFLFDKNLNKFSDFIFWKNVKNHYSLKKPDEKIHYINENHNTLNKDDETEDKVKKNLTHLKSKATNLIQNKEEIKIEQMRSLDLMRMQIKNFKNKPRLISNNHEIVHLREKPFNFSKIEQDYMINKSLRNWGNEENKKTETNLTSSFKENEIKAFEFNTIKGNQALEEILETENEEVIYMGFRFFKQNEFFINKNTIDKKTFNKNTLGGFIPSSNNEGKEEGNRNTFINYDDKETEEKEGAFLSEEEEERAEGKEAKKRSAEDTEKEGGNVKEDTEKQVVKEEINFNKKNSLNSKDLNFFEEKNFLNKQFKNIIIGITQGYSINLELKGIGYSAKIITIEEKSCKPKQIPLFFKKPLHQGIFQKQHNSVIKQKTDLLSSFVGSRQSRTAQDKGQSLKKIELAKQQFNNLQYIGQLESNHNLCVKKTKKIFFDDKRKEITHKNNLLKNNIFDKNQIPFNKLKTEKNSLSKSVHSDSNKEDLKIQNKNQPDKNILTLRLGTSHNIIYPLYNYEVNIKTMILQDNFVTLIIFGISNEIIKKVAAEIYLLKKPEPYKGKGIRYDGEKFFSKEGTKTKKN